MRVLFLTHRLPYAPNRGDRIRSYYMLRALAERAEVTLVSLVHDRDEQSQVANLRHIVPDITVALVPRVRNASRALGAFVCHRPLTHALLDAPSINSSLQRIMATRRPDVVFAYCSGMARFALESPLVSVPLVLDMVDVDSSKWAALAGTERVPQRWVYSREASSLARFETIAIRRAYATLVVNERERANALRLAPEGRVQVVLNGIDHDAFRPRMPPATEPRVVFCGVMNYRPNEEGALWLARDVWPLVRRARSDARLLLLGSDPTRAIRALASFDPTVEVSGSVADVRPHLWRSALSAAPLFVAPGIQNKVLEATAAGLPSIVTPDVFKGLPAEVVPACSVVSSAPDFAAAILKILDLSPAQRRRIADRADLDSLGWHDRLAPFVSIVEAAAQSGLNQRRVEEHMKYFVTVPGHCEHSSVAKP